ncbi:MAG: hypothetical protein V1656_02400 [Candidatus Jorgensenbacteria bacterium]
MLSSIEQQRNVLRKREQQPAIWTFIGEGREKIMTEVLTALKEEQIIADFMSAKDSKNDFVQGIDFYAVYGPPRTTRQIIGIQVTGRKWAAASKEAHPNVPVVVINVGISLQAARASVRAQIIEILKGLQ